MLVSRGRGPPSFTTTTTTQHPLLPSGSNRCINHALPTADRRPTPTPHQFLTTLVLSGVIGFVLWVIFEIKRNKRSVYAPRPAKLPHRAPPALAYGPLRWVRTVATMSGPETLRLAGACVVWVLTAVACVFCEVCFDARYAADGSTIS